MKHLIKITIVQLLLFSVIFSSNIHSSENKWKLEIKLDKQNYISHEPIWLDIELLNNRSETIRTHGLLYPNHREFFIELRDSNGEPVEYTGAQYSLAQHPGNLFLDPGEKEYGSFDLLKLFQFRKELPGYSDSKILFRYIPKGTYTVQVHYEGDFSNELTFNIVESFGDEKEVKRMIEDAERSSGKHASYPAAKKFQEIVDRFPNSVFAEICFHESRFLSKEIRDGMKVSFRESNNKIKMEMLENYPNSGDSKSWLRSITRDMDDSSKMNLLNNLKEANPNTRSAKFIEQMQRKIVKKLAEE